MTEMVIYHAVPPKMQGSILYPRNELRALHPELAAEYDASYEGREEVAATYIPTLDCRWGDVLFMSAVDPQNVIDTMREYGCPVDFQITAYKIPIRLLDLDKLTVMLTVGLGDGGKRFVPFSPKSFAEWQQIPQITRDHYAKMTAKGEQPFTYGGIPHFLYKGSVDTTDLETVVTH